jgi:hypothetical protein
MPREQVTEGIALLQDAGEEATALGRQGFKHKRRTHAPLPAHRDAEQGAQHQQDRQRWRESAGQLEQRVAGNVDDEGGAAAEALRDQTEKDRAHGTHRERKRNGFSNSGRTRMEIA